MKRIITRAVINALGGEELVDRAIAQYKEALEFHSKTTGIPAPAANPLIVDIVKNYDGYKVEEPIDPNPKLSVAEQALQDIEVLKGDYKVMQRQMLEMGAAVKEAREWAFFANNEVQRLGVIITELQGQIAELQADMAAPDEGA